MERFQSEANHVSEQNRKQARVLISGDRKALHSISRLDPDAFPEDRGLRDPTVNVPPVIADLETLTLSGSDQVKVLGAPTLPQNDIIDLKGRRVDRLDRAELAGFEPSGHGVTAWTELDGFALVQLLDVMARPAQMQSLREH